ncbi:unnamed protein product [Ectocarpus sp. 12 AP-2014]
MAYVDGARAVGIVLGSALGGVLAQPAEHFPETFSATGLLGTYPFLLPNLFGAGFSLLVLVLFVLYVPETIDLEKESSSSKLGSPRSSDVATLALPSSEEYSPRDHPQNAHRPLNGSGKEGRLAPGYVALEDSKDKRDGCAINQDDQQGLADDDAGSRLRSDEDGGKNCGGIDGGGSLASSVDDNEDPGLFGPSGLLSVPKVAALLFLVWVAQSLVTGFEEVYPLWALSTAGVGGLEWSTLQIGKALGATGFLVVVLTLFIIPVVVRVLGAAWWMRGCSVVGVLVFLATPNAKLLSWNYGTLFAMSVASNTLISCCLAAMFIALSVASTNIVPAAMRGKLGGLFYTAESLGRFSSAASFSVMYAWSVSSSSYGWVDHHFVFYVFALALALATALAWRTLTAEMFLERKEAGSVELVGSEDTCAHVDIKVGESGDIPYSRPAGRVNLV